jgi:hypothetical protein
MDGELPHRRHTPKNNMLNADVLKPGNVSPSQLIHAQPLSSLIWWMVVGDALGATVSQNIVVRPNYILLPPFQSSSV